MGKRKRVAKPPKSSSLANWCSDVGLSDHIYFLLQDRGIANVEAMLRSGDKKMLALMGRDRNLFLDAVSDMSPATRESLCEPLTTVDDNVDVTKVTAVKQEPPSGKDTMDVVKEAGLENYYPGKISLDEVMKVNDETARNTSTDLSVLPYLKQLIMLNHKARDDIGTAQSTAKGGKEVMKEADEANCMTDLIDLLGLDSYSSQCANGIHPQDYFFLVFFSCNTDLQSVIVQKCFFSRLAFPFVYQTAPGPLNMTFWPLRHVVPSWKNTQGDLVEMDAASAPTHIVSICRIGKSPTHRKSNMLNDLLTDVAHDTFFHWDCPNGTRQRKVSEGVVEAAWYMPSGKPTDIFANLTMFLNLRGECLQFCSQVDLLSEVSNVMVFVVDTELLPDEKLCSILLRLLDQAIGVIIVLTIQNSDFSSIKHTLERFKKMIGEGYNGLKIIPTFQGKGTGMRNTNDIKGHLRREIRALCDLQKAKVWSEMKSNFNKELVSTDEDTELCKLGHEFCQRVLATTADKGVEYIKRNKLSLQGELWKEWSILQKKKSRPSCYQEGISIKATEEIQARMNALRQKQLAACTKPSNLMKAFIKVLTSNQSIDERIALSFSLQWMKKHFDQLSREDSPQYHRKYQECWAKLQQQKEKLPNNDPTLQTLQAAVREAEKQLASTAFGLEHLFREVGQMYEAITEAHSVPQNKQIVKQLKQLPNIVAHLLLKGQSLELMDGDASNIPKAWITAVLSELSSIVGHKKIFIVSVLGVQSSGKSTLLNTMFGVQFAVSAGRCTKGVYMQLVQVDLNSGLPFDYVGIVDTEGLRAPELGMNKYDRDNELATLAIGLGDVTIMNIKGENYAEMKDVLQIAVHAFLRMKIVINSEYRHRCIFIHQNVPAVSADEKMKIACQKLQENLDTMTVEAAEQEKYLHVRTFNQIINFDCLKDVLFFPDLWHGDPPMASTNPGYSEKVLALRQKIFSELALERLNYTSMDDLSVRIGDLWNGILADDFVFSFRNSLEVKAFNGLEAKYQQIIVEVDDKFYYWEKSVADVHLKGCDSKESVTACAVEMEVKLEEFAAEVALKSEESLKQFCQSDTYADIIIQWQQSKIACLRLDIEKKSKRVRENMSNMVRSQEIDIFSKNENEKHIDTFTKRACSLALDMRRKGKCSKADLNREFEHLWQQSASEFQTCHTPTTTPEKIAAEIQSQLYQCFSADKIHISEELKTSPILVPHDDVTQLNGSLNADNLPIKHFSVKSKALLVSLWNKFKSDDAIKKKYLGHVITYLNESIFMKADEYLEGLPEACKFQAYIITGLFKRTVHELDSNLPLDEENVDIAFLPSLKAKLAVHICRFVYPIMCVMQQKFEAQYGHNSRIQTYKETLRNVFQNYFEMKSDEKIAADFLGDRLRGKLENHIDDIIPDRVKTELCRMFQSKQYVIREIMLEMVDLKSLTNFTNYISSPRSHATQWITAKGHQELLRSVAAKKTRLGELALGLLHDLCNQVRRALEAVEPNAARKNPKVTLRKWITAFCHSSVGIFGTTAADYPVTQLKSSKGGELVIADPKSFVQLVLKGLQSLEEDLEKHYATICPNALYYPSTLCTEVVDEIWGCEECCPFCKEPCILGQNHEVAHRCIQHRPLGIGKGYWVNTHVLVLMSCDYAVASRNSFFRDGRWIEYPMYKSIYPKWDILPEPDIKKSSSYWIWYLKMFVVQHCKISHCVVPELPDTWMKTTSEEAKGAIMKVY